MGEHQQDKAAKPKAAQGTAKDKEAALSKQQQAELELLMMDDHALRGAAKGVKAAILPAGVTRGSALAGLHEKVAAGGKLSKKEKRLMKKDVKARAKAGSDDDDAAGEGGSL